MLTRHTAIYIYNNNVYSIFMSKELEAFILGQDQKPIEELTSEELKKEVQLWRALFNWLDPRVKFYLAQIGSQVRLMTQFKEDIFGDLLTVKFEPTHIEVGVYERTFDRNSGAYFWERKIVVIDHTRLQREEFIEPDGRVPAVEDKPETNWGMTLSEPPTLEDNKN